ncbi:fungal hydrophobin domain-containing protein [Penicillium maclennaniae]|uniref:fungal hydrophobin domain-containing protein n=1 Tax=Penicillium maclennaniae TaxID=1343394 RepID=UPI0025415828|nr:fungal hydrophobin domain-containing protein [Penicillium maclennaniae]KAJ5681653.1 fungal hydrophobin domain-containing protein [Penicillium maclennaniae]
MKVSLLLLSISIGAGLAHPTTLAKRDKAPCSDAIYNFPSCCSSNTLSLADTKCKAASNAIDGASFKQSCGEGSIPKCCALNIADLGLLCQEF